MPFHHPSWLWPLGNAIRQNCNQPNILSPPPPPPPPLPPLPPISHPHFNPLRPNTHIQTKTAFTFMRQVLGLKMLKNKQRNQKQKPKGSKNKNLSEILFHVST